MSARGFFLFVLSSILFLAVFITAFGFGSFALLDSKSYTPYLEKHGVYTYIDSSLPAMTGQVQILQNISSKAIVDLVMERTLAYLNGETDTLNLTVNIHSPEIRRLAKEQIARLPVCDDGVDPVKDRVACKPKDADLDAILDQYLNDPQVESMQTSIDLAQYINPEGKLSQVRESIHTYKKAVYISALAAVIIAIAIILIGWSGRSRGLRNVGMPMFLAGIVIFTVFYFGNSALQTALTAKIPATEGFSAAALLADVLNGIYGHFMIISIVLAVVGAILWVCSILFARSEQDKN